MTAITELHGNGADTITQKNWRKFDASVRRRHKQSGWVSDVLDRAGIERVITDPYTDPLLDARQALGQRYNSVLRINCLACGWHPDARDHNGNSAHALLRRAGTQVASFKSAHPSP